MSELPAGFWKLDAYTNGYHIVVLGDPPQEPEEQAALHNCDHMGCSTMFHVLARIPIMYPILELDWAQGEGFPGAEV